MYVRFIVIMIPDHNDILYFPLLGGLLPLQPSCLKHLLHPRWLSSRISDQPSSLFYIHELQDDFLWAIQSPVAWCNNIFA